MAKEKDDMALQRLSPAILKNWTSAQHFANWSVKLLYSPKRFRQANVDFFREFYINEKKKQKKKKKQMKKQKPKNEKPKTKKIVEQKNKKWKTKNQKNVKRKTIRLDNHTLRSAAQSHIIVRCIVGRVVVKEWVTLCWFLLIIYGENGKFSKYEEIFNVVLLQIA